MYLFCSILGPGSLMRTTELSDSLTELPITLVRFMR